MIFGCPNCGKELRVKDELAGKKGKCPGCGNTITAPAVARAVPPRVQASRKQEAAQAPQQESTSSPTAKTAERRSRWLLVALSIAVVVLALCGFVYVKTQSATQLTTAPAAPPSAPIKPIAKPEGEAAKPDATVTKSESSSGSSGKEKEDDPPSVGSAEASKARPPEPDDSDVMKWTTVTRGGIPAPDTSPHTFKVTLRLELTSVTAHSATIRGVPLWTFVPTFDLAKVQSETVSKAAEDLWVWFTYVSGEPTPQEVLGLMLSKLSWSGPPSGAGLTVGNTSPLVDDKQFRMGRSGVEVEFKKPRPGDSEQEIVVYTMLLAPEVLEHRWSVSTTSTVSFPIQAYDLARLSAALGGETPCQDLPTGAQRPFVFVALSRARRKVTRNW